MVAPAHLQGLQGSPSPNVVSVLSAPPFRMARVACIFDLDTGVICTVCTGVCRSCEGMAVSFDVTGGVFVFDFRYVMTVCGLSWALASLSGYLRFSHTRFNYGLNAVMYEC